MGFPVILQVVGYQDSGKTTVITKLLKKLTQKGIKSGVLKHHGHMDKLAINDTGKDTESHRNAGAFITGISSSGGTIFSLEHELPPEKGIEIYKVLNIECVLIEGYKKIQYPRVILSRNKVEKDLIENSQNPIAVISDESLDNYSSIPLFLWNEENKWVDFLMEYLASRVDEERAYHETV
jgi:molybdopterin-guanine dinucleotide biosynthesis adapter protein